MKREQYRHIDVSKEAHRNLKIRAAKEGVSIAYIVDKLIASHEESIPLIREFERREALLKTLNHETPT